MAWKTFRASFAITALGLIVAFFYGGSSGLAVAAILGVLEISVSFDNAVVNATVLARMSDFWQRLFLTVGVLIAVVGMRLLFPVVIVCITAKISPAHAYHLAVAKGSSATPGTYGYLLHEAHPAIAAFGGAFLLMLFLNFIFEDRELTWLTVIERPLARIGKLDQLPVVVTAIAVILAANYLAPHSKTAGVLMAGSFGLITYIVVGGLGDLFEPAGADAEGAAAEGAAAEGAAAEGAGPEGAEADRMPGPDGIPQSGPVAAGPHAGRAIGSVIGKAAFFLFLYLEVLDATFSFDGVIGAFAITSDPIIIAIGLGIGAMYIRSLTVYLVHRGTLNEYHYLEHGAQWAIGALSVLLLITIKYQVPEVVTGLVGVGFIGAALISSIVRNRRAAAANAALPDAQPTVGAANHSLNLPSS